MNPAAMSSAHVPALMEPRIGGARARTAITPAWMLTGSIVAHCLGALALGALDASRIEIVEAHEVAVRLTVRRPEPAPALAPPPEVLPEIAPPPSRTRTRAERAEEAPPEPSVPTPLPPSMAESMRPASVDDVFGEEPAAPTALASSGGTGPAVASGSGGIAGTPGGTGTRIATGGAMGAPDDGDDEAARRRARLAYKRELERLLRSRSSYPRAALRERLEGRVELALRIGRDGAILGVRVAESSGYAMLDDAALDSARMDRVPAPPAATGIGERDELVVGVVYVVR